MGVLTVTFYFNQNKSYQIQTNNAILLLFATKLNKVQKIVRQGIIQFENKNCPQATDEAPEAQRDEVFC